MAVNKPLSAEIHPGPGFRVRNDFERSLDAALIEGYADFDSPDVSDLLNRLFALDSNIHSLASDHHKLIGPACTVRVFPGDNLMVHKALDIACPGDVVVIAAGGSAMNAVLGDLVCTKAKHRGIAGFIVDGLVRDLPGIMSLDLPVFARGTSPIGPLHRGPGEINCPIACGGVVVNAGDLIVADKSGVVSVPQGVAHDLLTRLRNFRESNATYLAAVARGDFSNAWVDRLLIEHGCSFEASQDIREAKNRIYAVI